MLNETIQAVLLDMAKQGKLNDLLKSMQVKDEQTEIILALQQAGFSDGVIASNLLGGVRANLAKVMALRNSNQTLPLFETSSPPVVVSNHVNETSTPQKEIITDSDSMPINEWQRLTKLDTLLKAAGISIDSKNEFIFAETRLKSQQGYVVGNRTMLGKDIKRELGYLGFMFKVTRAGATKAITKQEAAPNHYAASYEGHKIPIEDRIKLKQIRNGA